MEDWDESEWVMRGRENEGGAHKMGEGRGWKETDADTDRGESKQVKLTFSPPPSTSTPPPALINYKQSKPIK